MKKTELLETLETLKNQIFDLDVNAEIDTTELDEITEKSKVKEIETAISTAKKIVKKLETITDAEIEKALEKDGKKKVFKWTTLDGFYKIKLQTVTPEKIKVGYKMSFRLDQKKIEKIDNYFYYGNDPKNKIDFSSVDFENAQDIATVTKIDKNGLITLKSDARPSCKWYVYPEDINGTKSNKCVIKDGTNIAFLVYAPIEK